MPTAIITGASRGLGLALARGLAERSWNLVLDARGGEALQKVAEELSGTTEVVAIAGDVADEDHREQLVEAARAMGGPDLLVNNASLLGPSPQPKLADYPLDTFRTVYEVNVTAPLALIQRALPVLAQSPQGAVINVTSDAGVEGYEGWGGYGSSKAALEHLSKVLAAEHPELNVWWVDPGDMNTRMQQEAFPDEDVSDRPPPEQSVPGILKLIDENAPSGRYQARADTAAG
ncbi:MAG TPA: SDR family oxidoreductase [Acidimicrobiales bacterium]|nr:SDR family oxidoreductase [Acidimicrobiales bacterium]